ncbi:MAG: fimbrial major subunit CsuA/B family protein [Waddliaceae bacterium]|jgi:hypothetical protein|nr:fimbrial major subunit CsuA/B family protein [Waddliaceae bacterium]MBT3578594.1 fimbrial major subunit CsuA/B family protein [Waddliaceae bacterium]MBT4444653.1 fimbrial major subunit CsuA/B family protein [Waddliaceae bacterium]MBT6928841.1 fimbrial major subunit CsuA/B family protein [Waddliaceae bacterium]MBT7265105.1 fimbrial major subunit CsuA/B family protein [Waddliaceae bacterium]
MKKLFIIIGVMFCFVLYGHHSSDPDLELDIENITWEGSNNSNEYDAYSIDDVTQKVSFYVTYDESFDDNFFVTFSEGQSSDYDRFMSCGGETLSYQIYDSKQHHNILKEIPEASQNQDVIKGTDKHNKTRVQCDYYISIPAGQTSAAGVYTDTFVLRLYQGKVHKTYELYDTASVTFTAIIPATTQISLVNSGGSFDALDTSQNVDFGDITGPMSLTFDMLVLSSGSYSVAMESENGGVLKQNDVDDEIPYALKIDGNIKDLSGEEAVTVASGSEATPSGGDTFHVTVSVDTITQPVLSGEYNDVVYIEVSSTE